MNWTYWTAEYIHAYVRSSCKTCVYIYIYYIYNEHMYTIGPRGSHVRLCQKEHDTIVYDVYIYIITIY